MLNNSNPVIEALIELIKAHADTLAYIGIASIVLLIATALLMPLFIIALPHDYFLQGSNRQGQPRRRSAMVFFAVSALRNVIGIVLLIAGIVMLFVPGQGLLTILIALVLIDFPGKHVLLMRLAASPRVMRGANRIRRLAGKADFLEPGADRQNDS